MAEYRGFEILDLVVFIVQRKRKLLTVFFASLICSYAFVYFFVENKYEANATIIPSEDQGILGISSMLKGLKNLPIDIGNTKTTPSTEMDRYITIIYSRTMIENIIRHFDLYRVYEIDTTAVNFREETIKKVRRDITTEVTKENAFDISARSNTAQRAADIVNYIIAELNTRIIDLHISKSHDNKIFLQGRVADISKQLKDAEDSLQNFQERSGLLDIKSQIPDIMSIYAKVETELMTRKLKRNVLAKLLDKDAPEVKSLNVEINEYQKKLDAMRTQSEKGSVILALKSLPKKAVSYLRFYRQIDIDNSLLEFILPLYEQAKIEEKKDYPILQVVDYGVPPSKRSWPPRTLIALAAAFFISCGIVLTDLFKQKIDRSTNPNVIFLKNELSSILRVRRK